jgi:predicted porin
MQKKFITLAVIAAFSTPAFADVTTYGIIDAAIVNVSASGQKSDLLAYSGGLSGSRIGAKVTEDLGDGLTAVGVLEYALDTEVSTGLSTATARQQMLAVAGGFGTVASGYLQTTGYDFGVKFDPTAGSAISVLQAVTKGNFLIGSGAVAARAQRAVAYISPDFSGLTVAVNYSTALAGLGDLTVADTATTGLKTSAYLLSGNYTAGPLNVGLVYAGTNNASTNTSTTSEYALGGSYDLGVAKILATYQSSANSSTTTTLATTNTAFSLTGVLPVDKDAVVVTYAANTMATANTSASGASIGYLRTLSKTTTAYVAYSGVTNGSATHTYSVINNALSVGTLTNGGSSSLIAVGLRKKF